MKAGQAGGHQLRIGLPTHSIAPGVLSAGFSPHDLRVEGSLIDRETELGMAKGVTKALKKGERVEWNSHGGKKSRRGVAIGSW